MSSGEATAQDADTYLLKGKALYAFLDVSQRRIFEPGEWIASPGRPLMAWHLIERGAVVTADDAVADLTRRGLVLERHDMFGEYSLIPGAAPFPSRLRALTKVVTRFVKAEIFPGLKGREPSLEKLVQDRVTLNTHLASFVSALKRYPGLTDVPLYQLIKIAQRGTVSTYDAAQTLLVRQNDERLVFVAEGAVRVDDSVLLQAGAIFRGLTRTGQRQVSEGTCLVELDWEAISGSVPNYVRLSIAMSQQATESAATESAATESAATESARKDGTPVVVRLASDASDTPISALCTLLAETLQLDQPSSAKDPFKAVVVRLYPDEESRKKAEDQDQDKAIARRLQDAGGEVRGVVPSELEGLWSSERWTDKKEPYAPRVPHVALIDDTALGEKRVSRDLNQQLKTSKLLYFARDSLEVPDDMKSPTMSVVRCVFLRGGDVSKSSSTGEPGRMFVAAYHPGTVRLRFDDLQSLAGRTYRGLSERDQRSLSRCGRALMERRVGLALGGGGAWGYAHIALIEALEEVQLPIDIVSGVSFGSLAGGFYAAGGLPLLYQLIPRGVKLQLALFVSSFVPPLVHQYLTALLEDRMLQFLETPFFPVGLNLETGEEWSPSIGPLSQGIRAASSLPGMFSPMLADGVRSIDGVFVNNVPEGVLTRECADFIIASDVMQTPGDPYAPPPRWASSTFQRAWLTLKSLSPVSRMRDNMDATAFLTKIADERDQGLSNQRFEPGRSGLAMWDFSKGNQIIAMARREAQVFARKAYADWIALPTPRMS